MNFLEMIPGVTEANVHVAATLLVFILLLAGSLLIYAKTRNPEKCVVPGRKLSLLNFFEVVVENIVEVAREIVGKNPERYVPFIGTIFTFILVSNLLGMIPGFVPPTENINTNLACALAVFVASHYFGIREHGFKYVKKFMAPVTGIFGIFLSLIFIPIELSSHIFRPMSLSIRLFGNINGDHTVLSIFTTQIPVLKEFPIFIPVLFMGLGLLVAFLQAFIFTLLSMIYISMAVSHDH